MLGMKEDIITAITGIHYHYRWELEEGAQEALC